MDKNIRRNFIALGAALLLGAAVAPMALADGKSPIAKAVLQVSDNDPVKWNLALNNARNVQADLGAENVDLEIVAYGPGLNMLTADSPVAKRVAEALQAGVKIVACENTMKGRKLVYADMLPNIGYAEAGVVELIRKQQQGYAYIRP